MLATLFLSCLLSPPTALSSAGVASLTLADDPQITAKIAAAGKDIAKLLELAAACSMSGAEEDAKKVYRRILELDAQNEAAHKGLGHSFYDGKWFDSIASLVKYKRDEDAQMKKKGLARWKESWVPEGDVPYLQMSWIKDARGAWAHPLDLERAKQVAEWQAAGWKFRADDDSWIAPADFDKWQALRWKCGDDWLDMTEANAYHAKLEHPWRLEGEHFVVSSTSEWETANLARWHADRIYADLVRLFGVEPATKPRFIVLSSLAQYNQAAGNQGTLWESEGFSSIHGAYFADCTFDFLSKPPRHLACGVSYWDRQDAKSAPWGPFLLRWAAAQSFVDAIDPSWSAVGTWIAKEGKDDIETFKGPFWGEKLIPRWLRFGAASYAERFLKNPEAPEGSDPWSLRAFAFSELAKAGKLHSLAEVFEFKLSTENAENSVRLYQEAGLVVAYLLDGGAQDADLAKKHQAFKESLKGRKRADVNAACAALQAALAKHERDVKKFAGLATGG
jgi:hypothetical protein